MRRFLITGLATFVALAMAVPYVYAAQPIRLDSCACDDGGKPSNHWSGNKQNILAVVEYYDGDMLVQVEESVVVDNSDCEANFLAELGGDASVAALSGDLSVTVRPCKRTWKYGKGGECLANGDPKEFSKDLIACMQPVNTGLDPIIGAINDLVAEAEAALEQALAEMEALGEQILAEIAQALEGMQADIEGACPDGEAMVEIYDDGSIRCAQAGAGLDQCEELQVMAVVDGEWGCHFICQGEIVNYDNDPRHCGGCQQPCVFDNARGACVDAVCEISSCDGGWENCDGDGANGCEADVDNDDNNCGACGIQCGAQEGCSGGQCIGAELLTEDGEAYGHHGACSGWNQCGNADTCARWACQYWDYADQMQHDGGGPCPQYRVCHLFYGGCCAGIQFNWGNWCNVSGVSEIWCLF